MAYSKGILAHVHDKQHLTWKFLIISRHTHVFLVLGWCHIVSVVKVQIRMAYWGIDIHTHTNIDKWHWKGVPKERIVSSDVYAHDWIMDYVEKGKLQCWEKKGVHYVCATSLSSFLYKGIMSVQGQREEWSLYFYLLALVQQQQQKKWYGSGSFGGIGNSKRNQLPKGASAVQYTRTNLIDSMLNYAW